MRIHLVENLSNDLELNRIIKCRYLTKQNGWCCNIIDV